MPVISDGSGIYALGPNGERNYGNTTNITINDEVFVEFDPATGVLKISTSDAGVKKLIEMHGNLPIEDFVLPDPMGGICHFFGVTEVRSMPRKDGSFLLQFKEEELNDFKKYEGKKTTCDNCGRQFDEGEIISVDSHNNLVFCYTDGDGGCGIAYTFSHGKTTCGESMVFGEALTGRAATPNHPNTPIAQASKKQNWFKRLLNWLRNF